MSLLDKISHEIQHHAATHVLKPEWLYIQRHLHNDLLGEISHVWEGEEVPDMLFGLQVVWVQHETHPLVRVC